MKSSVQDKAEGLGREIKGRAKEAVGRVRKDPDQVDEGVAEQVSGKAQRKVGDVKKVFGQ